MLGGLVNKICIWLAVFSDDHTASYLKGQVPFSVCGYDCSTFLKKTCLVPDLVFCISFSSVL